MSPRGGKAKAKKKHPKKKNPVKAKDNPKEVLLCNCFATPDPQPLSKGKSEQALWRSCDDQGYEITFDVSPFSSSHFTVKPHGTTPSGPIKKDAYDDYKYTVDGDNGCHHDPIIHIGP